MAQGLGGKSSRAVGNVLARLEAAGEARLVSSSPRRYRIVAGLTTPSDAGDDGFRGRGTRSEGFPR